MPAQYPTGFFAKTAGALSCCCCCCCCAADPNSALQAYKSPITGMVALVDAQGNRAVVVGGGSKYGRIMFYDISAVLMSSSYFFNFMEAFKVSCSLL
jgi:hypothetical protein